MIISGPWRGISKTVWQQRLNERIYFCCFHLVSFIQIGAVNKLTQVPPDCILFYKEQRHFYNSCMRGPVLHIERCYGIFKKGTIVSQIPPRRVSRICCNLRLCPLHKVCFLHAIHKTPRSAFAGTVGKNCAMTQTRLVQTLFGWNICSKHLNRPKSLSFISVESWRFLDWDVTTSVLRIGETFPSVFRR